MNNIQKDLGKRSGIDVDKMKQAIQKGKLEDYLNSSLSSDTAKQVKNVLSSKEATEKLLSSAQAKELMKKLGLK
ncbi:MAG: hypothetical protein J1E81_03725 [Eubacterium sp.]|nr:hypothetical protein [Eubacterium sp.]